MRLPDHIPHWLLVLLLLVVTLLGLRVYLQTELQLTNGTLGVPLDDAWIHYQFARNLSGGEGFSFNPGEPTPGSTAPLWTLLLAGVGLFSADFLVPSLVLSGGFLLLTVGLTYGFAYSLSENRLAAFLAALGVALAGRLLWAALAGMETTMFMALSVAAVWTYMRQGLRPLPALLFALAAQTRPEGHALFAFAVLDTVVAWRWPLNEKGSDFGEWRPLLIAVGIYALVAAPYAIFSLATTGKPLPNTFYAKVGTEHFFSLRTLQETVMLHWRDNPASLVLVLFGLLPTWQRSRLAVAWLLGLPLLTAVIVDFVWHHGRYTMPLIPFQMAVAAAGIQYITQRLQFWPPRHVAVILIFFAGSWSHFPDWANMLATNTKEILEIDVALGRWLARNTAPDALLAVDDIGAITFLSQRRIVDLNGLVSPEMWPAVRQPVGLPRNQVATKILSRLQPDYMVAFPLWHWEIATNPAVANPLFRAFTDTHTIIAEQEAVVYRMTWPYVGQAAPQNERTATLAGAIGLLGYDWQITLNKQTLLLTLYWQSLAPVTADYDVFVHLLDAEGQIVAQADQQPLQGLAATHLWQPGDIIRDPYRLALPQTLPAGTYMLYTGMYLRESGVRLAARGEKTADDAIFLTEVVWP